MNQVKIVGFLRINFLICREVKKSIFRFDYIRDILKPYSKILQYVNQGPRVSVAKII